MQYIFEHKGKWIKQFTESEERETYRDSNGTLRYSDTNYPVRKSQPTKITSGQALKAIAQPDTTDNSIERDRAMQNQIDREKQAYRDDPEAYFDYKDDFAPDEPEVYYDNLAKELDDERYGNSDDTDSEPENEIDKYSGHNSITASVPVARQTLMDLADKFNGTYNKSKKRVEFKKNSDMQKAIKALRELPAGRFNYVFSSNYFGDGYQVKPKDYNVESAQRRNEDKVFVRNMTTGNSYYINKDSFDAHKHELLDNSQQSSTDTQATSLAFEVHDLQSQVKQLEKEVQRYKKLYNDSMRAIDSPYTNYEEIERNKQRASKANDLLTIASDKLNNAKAKLTKKQNALKKIKETNYVI